MTVEEVGGGPKLLCPELFGHDRYVEYPYGEVTAEGIARVVEDVTLLTDCEIEVADRRRGE